MSAADNPDAPAPMTATLGPRTPPASPDDGGIHAAYPRSAAYRLIAMMEIGAPNSFRTHFSSHG